MMTPDRPVITWITQTPVQVPVDFLGMHFNAWPQGRLKTSPAPDYPYGPVRSVNYDPALRQGPQLREVFPAANKIDDAALAGWAAANEGHTRIWTMGGMPTWAADGTESGPWGGAPGASCPPKDMPGMAARVAKVAKKLGIEWVETWNEPDPDIPAGSQYNRWFAGTMQQLAQWQAALQDAGLQVMGPAFTDMPDYGGPSSKVHRFAKACVRPPQAWSWHWYEFTGDVSKTALALDTACRGVKRAVGEAYAGAVPPIWITELGGENWPASVPADDVAGAVYCWLAVAAAHGMRHCILYAHELDYIGAPAKGGVAHEVLLMFADRLAGKTILQAAILEGGDVWIELQP